MMIPKKHKKNQFPKYLSLIGIAAQMGITIYLCAFLGKKLDLKFPNDKNYFTIFLTLFGVFGSMTIIIKQLNRLNQD